MLREQQQELIDLMDKLQFAMDYADGGARSTIIKLKITQLVEQIEHGAAQLPDSIKEALNSGDGTYRP